MKNYDNAMNYKNVQPNNYSTHKNSSIRAQMKTVFRCCGDHIVTKHITQQYVITKTFIRSKTAKVRVVQID